LQHLQADFMFSEIKNAKIFSLYNAGHLPNMITKQNKKKMMKIHIISETAFYAKGMGVHTAFIDSINLLRKKKVMATFSIRIPTVFIIFGKVCVIKADGFIPFTPRQKHWKAQYRFINW
jgi:hypothetical protein